MPLSFRQRAGPYCRQSRITSRILPPAAMISIPSISLTNSKHITPCRFYPPPGFRAQSPHQVLRISGHLATDCSKCLSYKPYPQAGKATSTAAWSDCIAAPRHSPPALKDILPCPPTTLPLLSPSLPFSPLIGLFMARRTRFSKSSSMGTRVRIQPPRLRAVPPPPARPTGPKRQPIPAPLRIRERSCLRPANRIS